MCKLVQCILPMKWSHCQMMKSMANARHAGPLTLLMPTLLLVLVLVLLPLLMLLHCYC